MGNLFRIDIKTIFVKKRLKNKFTIVNDLEQIIPKMDLVIICTHMSEYEKIILSISKYLNAKTILTDVASSKEKIIKISNFGTFSIRSKKTPHKLM